MSDTGWGAAPCRQDCVALKDAVGERSVTLASGSPRRRVLLRACGVTFRVIRPRIEEPSPNVRFVREWARRWALRKALSVIADTDTDLIWGADTIVVHQGRGMGKPVDRDDARTMLRRLSGSTHEVITGVAVATSGGRHHTAGTALSRVRFRKLTTAEIQEYIATGEPMDKAGAYAIQGGAGAFVSHVEGPIDNIIGLPIKRLAQLTQRMTNNVRI